MKNILIAMIFSILVVGCTIEYPIEVQCKYVLTQEEEKQILIFFNQDVLNYVREHIYYKDLRDIGASGLYSLDSKSIFISPLAFPMTTVLHETMHYYQYEVLKQPYRGDSENVIYLIYVEDIGKVLTTEQEANGVSMIWNYANNGPWCWSTIEQDKIVVAYLIPYYKSLGMLGG